MYEHSDNKFILGVDVGGSHITTVLIDAGNNQPAIKTIARRRVEKGECKEIILGQWVETIRQSLAKMPDAILMGIGFAMPGPFNYKEGISLMKGNNKYESLYNINIQEYIKEQFNLRNDFPMIFENDASCFGLGESFLPDVSGCSKVIAATLGTGFGATFLENNKILKDGEDVPHLGQLYDQPYLGGIAEDHVSAAWILKQYNHICSESVQEVKTIAERATQSGDRVAQQVMTEFGTHLAACIIPWIKKFKPDCLVIGGSIANSANLFIEPLQTELARTNIQLKIKISTLMETSAMMGAASLVKASEKQLQTNNNLEWRKTSQALLPVTITDPAHVPGQYGIYPFYNIGEKVIFSGYDSLANWIANKKTVVIDGYGGNDWVAISTAIGNYLSEKDIKINWHFTSHFLKSPDEITALVAPFLGEANAVWGTKTSLSLKDFYNISALSSITPDDQYSINIVIGTGAAFCGWDNIIYIDLPKNEIQYRMRAGSITNLGSAGSETPAMMYKRFYFVDWIVYNKHRQHIASRLSIIADGQWKTTITWSLAAAIQKGLAALSTDVIRARPWFEAGTWGGNWMKEHIPQINQHEINYAWSFELIAPENGLVLESDHNLLEISFDWLMELQTIAVLGKDAARFGTAFPIRFDFLDTFDGGNLSIQCHPSLQYIQENFGEEITQDETYYILDCKADAKVYLGFQEDINAGEFKAVLQQSVEENKAIEIDKYVNSFPAHKHDLFLIPNRTIHSSGINNMVLEISATPYIFTFKMYDWVRLDLDGNPRPINIEHAFNNLDFSRKGAKVAEELISKQTLLHSSDDCRVMNLSTHNDHFYKVERLEFTKRIAVDTNNQCHVLMLVEGTSITVKTKLGKPTRFNYAETFIIPAAAEDYEIVSDDGSEVKVVKAFIK